MTRLAEGTAWAAEGFAGLAEADLPPGRVWQEGRRTEIEALAARAAELAAGPGARRPDAVADSPDADLPDADAAARAWAREHERLVDLLGTALAALRLTAVGAGDVERAGAPPADPLGAAGVALLAASEAFVLLLERHLESAPTPLPRGIEPELERAAAAAWRAEATALGEELRPAAPGLAAAPAQSSDRAPGDTAPPNP
jgi:hypothetical protein